MNTYKGKRGWGVFFALLCIVLFFSERYASRGTEVQLSRVVGCSQLPTFWLFSPSPVSISQLSPCASWDNHLNRLPTPKSFLQDLLLWGNSIAQAREHSDMCNNKVRPTLLCCSFLIILKPINSFICNSNGAFFKVGKQNIFYLLNLLATYITLKIFRHIMGRPLLQAPKCMRQNCHLGTLSHVQGSDY